MSLSYASVVFPGSWMFRVLKIALKVLVFAPVFTIAVVVAILFGTIFDLERPRGTPDRLGS